MLYIFILFQHLFEPSLEWERRQIGKQWKHIATVETMNCTTLSFSVRRLVYTWVGWNLCGLSQDQTFNEPQWRPAVKFAGGWRSYRHGCSASPASRRRSSTQGTSGQLAGTVRITFRQSSGSKTDLHIFFLERSFFAICRIVILFSAALETFFLKFMFVPVVALVFQSLLCDPISVSGLHQKADSGWETDGGVDCVTAWHNVPWLGESWLLLVTFSKIWLPKLQFLDATRKCIQYVWIVVAYLFFLRL